MALEPISEPQFWDLSEALFFGGDLSRRGIIFQNIPSEKKNDFLKPKSPLSGTSRAEATTCFGLGAVVA